MLVSSDVYVVAAEPVGQIHQFVSFISPNLVGIMTAGIHALQLLACCLDGSRVFGQSAAPWWTISDEKNALSLALHMDREKDRHFSPWEDHNALSSDKFAVSLFEYARSPTVNNICEVGFHAGHSAAIMLNASPKARVISFDILQYPYSRNNAAMLKDLFGDRFEVFWGPSQFVVPQFMEVNIDVLCDMFVIDGEHTLDSVYTDLVNFQKMSSCRNWVIMDDAEGDGTSAAWQRAKDDGIISEIRCLADEHPTWHWELMAYQPGSRSWCIGFFNKDEETCPRWRDLAPPSPTLDLRKIVDPAQIMYNSSKPQFSSE